MRRSIRLCGHDIDQPGHICAFFGSREEEYDTLIPYLQDGLDDGEHVLNVLDASRLDDHRERLIAAGLSVDAGLSIASAEDTYLADGRFDMDRMVDFIRTQLGQSAERGRRVRTAGWMNWIQLEAPGTERVLEYEARMNQLVRVFDCTFMCVYDLSTLSGAAVIDVMATHPYVILRGDIRKNPFYVPPDVYLRELIGRPTRTRNPDWISA